MNLPPIVNREDWLVAREELLAKEKEFTKIRDELTARRRRLPMVEIDKDYVFAGPAGEVRLLDLFDGSRQLIVYHFMWLAAKNEGCASCSLVLDNVADLAHLRARDTAFAVVTRGPIEDSLAFRTRMGWTVPWFSSADSDFNYDFHVTLDPAVAPPVYNYQKLDSDSTGEGHGISVFLRDEERVFHTYSTYARGADMVLGTYHYLDLTPFGRQEAFEDSPAGWPQTPTFGWIRHHDKYEVAG